MSNRYILLVEDDTELREVLVELLQDEGHRVVHAENGNVALEYLRSHSAPDLVLLDFMMPIMDGKMFCEERKTDELIRQIPVALLTAATISKDIIDKMQVSTVLTKPIDMDTFLKTVKQYSPV